MTYQIRTQKLDIPIYTKIDDDLNERLNKVLEIEGGKKAAHLRLALIKHLERIEAKHKEKELG